jgi:tetratricopeptide (TPR) repeat protein
MLNNDLFTRYSRVFETWRGGVVSSEPQPSLQCDETAPKTQWVMVAALWHRPSDWLEGLRLLRGRFEGKGAIGGRTPFPVADSAETTPPLRVSTGLWLRSRASMGNILFFLFLSAGLLGCALAPFKESLQAPEDCLARDSIAKAQQFEAAGQFPEALRQYKIALTVWPNDRVAEEGQKRVEKALRRGSQEHYKAGLRLQKEGKQPQALQQFLTALRLWPDHREALQMATARVPAPVEKQAVQKAQTEPLIKEMPALPLSEKTPVQEEQEEDVEQIAVYREYGMELYGEGRYQEAFSEFTKVLGVKPDDPVAREYSYRTSFELAMEFFQKKDYLAAKEQFLVSLKFKSNCQQCHVYIRRSEELFKELHYKQGIEYYGKEQLADAIVEWEMVRGVDPSYKRVDYYIKKAKDLQCKIDELKNELEEEGQE